MLKAHASMCNVGFTDFALVPVAGLRVIAFDPSLSCTGVAVLDIDRQNTIVLRRLGYIDGPSGPDVWPRVRAVKDEAMRIMAAVPSIAVAAVEMPMTQMGGVPGGRGRATLPNYGVMVGAIADAVESRGPGAFYHPSATQWASGLKTGGKGKPERVSTAAILTGINCEEYFGKTRAENVADAVLLARWAGLKAIEEGAL